MKLALLSGIAILLTAVAALAATPDVQVHQTFPFPTRDDADAIGRGIVAYRQEAPHEQPVPEVHPTGVEDRVGGAAAPTSAERPGPVLQGAGPTTPAAGDLPDPTSEHPVSTPAGTTVPTPSPAPTTPSLPTTPPVESTPPTTTPSLPPEESSSATPTLDPEPTAEVSLTPEVTP